MRHKLWEKNDKRDESNEKISALLIICTPNQSIKLVSLHKKYRLKDEVKDMYETAKLVMWLLLPICEISQQRIFALFTDIRGINYLLRGLLCFKQVENLFIVKKIIDRQQ